MENIRRKMYVLVKDSIPPNFAILSVAHASLACYLKFKEDPEVIEWLKGPFYKVICKVTEQEFEKAKSIADSVIITESALDNIEVAIAFKPRAEWDKFFKFLRLYK